jgi:predicted acylesterase/phospholipase RssA
MTTFNPNRRSAALLLFGGALVATSPAIAAPSRKKPSPKPEPVKAAAKAERRPFTAEDQLLAEVPGFPDARFFGDDAAAFRDATREATGAWITLSGGGEDGAYGAGVLTGLTNAGTRPEFSLVVGASTGALMGPYVFLGSKYDAALRQHYTSVHSGDIFELMETPESMFDTWPLKKLIEKSITADMLTAIAAEHAKGRRLFATTTNLDAGRTVIWNIGAIAVRASEQGRGGDDAVRLVRQVLLASSSIPGFFPPVHIEVAAGSKTFSEMHADGSIQVPFYVAPEAVLAGRGGERLAASELYVMVNNKVNPDFSMAERSTAGVLARSISVAMKAGLRGEVVRIGTMVPRHGLPLQIAVVPNECNVEARGMFDPAYMQALFAYGAERGKNGGAFGSNAMAAIAGTASGG